MKAKLIIFTLIYLFTISCSHTSAPDSEPEHEHPKFQITSYTSNFELFAEADYFLAGESANVLAHFSTLPDFKALESGNITIRLNVNGIETKQTLEKSTRKGIYSFDIKPETVGTGELIFDIKNNSGEFQMLVPDIVVYTTEAEVHTEAEKAEISATNTVVFTKEQSWKIEFSSEKPMFEPFGQVIKTTAQIQSAPGDETFITAKINGLIQLKDMNLLEGKSITKGQNFLSILGNQLADNNSSVRFLEAQNNFEKAKSDYERLKELAKDKIVSERELLIAKNEFDNTKIVYTNLKQNFNASGQNIKSPINGFIKQVFIKNGQSVEAGDALLLVSNNKQFVLHSEIQQKYMPYLSSINSVVIQTPDKEKTYTLEELNGRIASIGRSANTDNYLIPLNIQIENNGDFIPGGFVKVFLKTQSNAQAMTLPNTALLEEQGNFFVFVQINPELFEKRQVKTGETDGLKTEIISGIDREERIVCKGAILIKLAKGAAILDPHSGHVH